MLSSASRVISQQHLRTTWSIITDTWTHTHTHSLRCRCSVRQTLVTVRRHSNKQNQEVTADPLRLTLYTDVKVKHMFLTLRLCLAPPLYSRLQHVNTTRRTVKTFGSNVWHPEDESCWLWQISVCSSRPSRIKFSNPQNIFGDSQEIKPSRILGDNL